MSSSPSSKQIFDITTYGAVGDGKAFATEAINAAIDACAKAGGGTVRVPSGIFLSSTVVLQSHVDLFLEKGAVILGSPEVDTYKNFAPTKNLDHLNSGGNSANANNMNDTRWTRALILGQGITNVTISGEGIIDGDHVFDPLGEENMRGAHTLLLAESTNVTVCGITITRSANYAVTAYDVTNVVFQNLTITEGWDAIHIRGGRNILIRNCEFYTGDDCIAGGFWENMVITNCVFNTSCNGMRVIMPVKGLCVSHCSFFGPGRFPHRTSGAMNRTNMINGIYIEPGGWGDNPGDLEDISITDVSMDNMAIAFGLVLHEGNNGGRITIDGLKATNIAAGAASTESRKGGVFNHLTLRNVDIGYSESLPGQEGGWGLALRSVINATLENVSLYTAAKVNGPAISLEGVCRPVFKNVTYPTTPGVEPIHSVKSGRVQS